MNNLRIFNNPEFGQIRMVEINDKSYAVGNDVARALEYAEPHKAIANHCRGGITYPVTDALGREQETKVIPEGDIYRLIVKAADQSKNAVIKEKAERFERWIFDDVLPTIHRHGLYATDNVIEKVICNPDFGIQLLYELKAEREKRQQFELQTAQQSQIIQELSPKASYYDLVLQNKSLLSITQIAKDYGMSGTELNKTLHELGVQYKQSGVWLLYSHYAANGYTQSKTHVIDAERNAFHTYWTQKGRLFIYDLLKSKKGILPLIEREHKKEA